MGGRARLLLARIPEDRVLRLLQRIAAATEDVAPRVQPARVQAQRERGPGIEPAARGDRPVGVRGRPDSYQSRAGDGERAGFREQLQRHLDRRVARLELECAGPDLAPRPQLDREPAGRRGQELQAHG